MSSLPCQALGTNIITACGNERPESTSNSNTLSRLAESEPLGRMMGNMCCKSAPNRVLLSSDSRAHPVAVADDGIDLTVVGHHAKRVAPSANWGTYWSKSGCAPTPSPIPYARPASQESMGPIAAPTTYPCR